MTLFRLVTLVLGIYLVLITLLTTVKTFVVPRSENLFLARIVMVTMMKIFRLRAGLATTFDRRDRVMALYAPLTLLVMVFFWVVLILIGFTLIYWGLGIPSWFEAFSLSGSSLLTLGFVDAETFGMRLIEFSEAIIGLGLVALIMAYLPTMYGAFSQRETAVTLLEVRAGNPPWAVEWIQRACRLNSLAHMNGLFADWEQWFAHVDESHTSLIMLVFFRSPRSHHSWITAAGAVMDTAALMASAVDVPRMPQAELALRAGYLALRHIADYFEIAYDPDPQPTDPISISRPEFDAAWEQMAAAGVPLKADQDQAYRDFQGWRVNYDTVLLAIAALAMAPYAPWSSDRSIRRRPSRFNRLVGF